MIRIWHFNNDRIDHWDIRAHGNTIVQEPGVFQLTLVVVYVFLVKRPTNSLDGTTLHLPFNVSGVDRFASILDCGVANDRNFSCLSVYLNVHDMCSKAWSCACYVHRTVGHDGATCFACLLRDLCKTHRFGFVSSD